MAVVTLKDDIDLTHLLIAEVIGRLAAASRASHQLFEPRREHEASLAARPNAPRSVVTRSKVQAPTAREANPESRKCQLRVFLMTRFSTFELPRLEAVETRNNLFQKPHIALAGLVS